MTRRILSLTAAFVLVSAAAALLLRPAGAPPPTDAGGESGRSPAVGWTATAYGEYIWPTDAGRKMTSSFAEFRRTHFHGGIDIGTGSTTGFRVFAMRDGYVSRIRVSPTGYGRMLFVRHADGFSTTYAHLSTFNESINARVLREQRLLGRFAVEIDCAAGEFPVRSGEVIAYTGETGVGTPHLHFEIRDPAGDFVNPMLCDAMRVEDTVPPTVRRIAVRPLDEDALVDGDWEPRVYEVRRTRNGSLTIEGTIRVTGSAGIAVDARDRSNASGFRHGVYGYDLYLDDHLVHRHRLDRAPNETSQQIMLYYDWDLLARGRGRFEKLYADGPHDLPFLSSSPEESGVIGGETIAPGAHALRIAVTDFNGNTTEVRGTVVINHPPAFSVARHEREYTLSFSPSEDITRFIVSMKRWGASTWKPKTLYPDSLSRLRGFTLPHPDGAFDLVQVVAENSNGTHSHPRYLYFGSPRGTPLPMRLSYEVERRFVRLTLTSAGEFSAPPSVTVYEGENRRSIPLTPGGMDHWTATFRPLETFTGTRRLSARGEVNGHAVTANAEFDLYPIVAGDSGRIVLDGGNLVLAYDPASVFRTEFLRVEKESGKGETTYLVKPEHIALRGGLSVTVRAPGGLSKPALFATGIGSSVELLASSPGGDDTEISGRMTRTVGDIVVTEDVTPPHVSRLQVGGAQGGKPFIRFRYGDDLSGVDYQEFKMYIDDQIVVPEIDGEHRRAFHQVTAPLARGSHRLLIRLKDRLGNTSEVERRFTVR